MKKLILIITFLLIPVICSASYEVTYIAYEKINKKVEKVIRTIRVKNYFMSESTFIKLTTFDNKTIRIRSEYIYARKIGE